MLYGYYQALAVHVSLITYLLGPTAVAVGLMGKLSSWELVVWENPAVLCPQFLGLMSLMSGLASQQLVALQPLNHPVCPPWAGVLLLKPMDVLHTTASKHPSN